MRSFFLFIASDFIVAPDFIALGGLSLLSVEREIANRLHQALLRIIRLSIIIHRLRNLLDI